ncbi:hypothetical protein NicSoilB11_17690 [Arthrobacter sp. NicSoilB11]|nr:hypothetical protein NicSoilB11_17690 [Arthrobacter sp. NicSoilB11]
MQLFASKLALRSSFWRTEQSDRTRVRVLLVRNNREEQGCKAEEDGSLRLVHPQAWEHVASDPGLTREAEVGLGYFD